MFARRGRIPEPHTAIHRNGQTTQIRVDRTAAGIWFYVNDTLLTSTNGASFSNAGCDAGVRAYSTPSAAPVDMRFDNSAVYRLL